MGDRSLIAGVTVALLCVLAVGACGDDTPSGTEAVCALNEDFERLNERTIDGIPSPDEGEPIPASYAPQLEENWVEGVKLMRQMVESAPQAIKADLSRYTEAQAEMSWMYAEHGYDQARAWENVDFYEAWFAEYPDLEEVRQRIEDWFTENCGMGLQG